MADDDWLRSDDDEALEALRAQVADEQERILRDEVPAKLAETFNELYGDGWRDCSALIKAHASAVAKVRSVIRLHIDQSTASFAAARDGVRPLLH